MVKCFTFFQKSILLSSRNYNSKFLYTLEIYLHKSKLISSSLSHSLENTYLKKSLHIWCLYFTKISGNFVLKPLENLENSGNFTLKSLSEPCWRLNLFFSFRVTNSRLKTKPFHFELLIRWVNFCFFLFELRKWSW